VEGGDYNINVKILGKMRYLKTENVSQISADYICTISSADNGISANMTINPSITVLGTRKKKELEEKIRKITINKLIKSIEQL
jgi:hypothetical protein